MKERMNRKGMNDRKIGLFLQFGKFTIFSPSVFLFFFSLVTVSSNLKISGPGRAYNKYSCPVSHCCIFKDAAGWSLYHVYHTVLVVVVVVVVVVVLVIMVVEVLGVEIVVVVIFVV